MPRILSVSSGRADVGILLSVWQAIAAMRDCELHVLLTGMHMATDAPAVTALPARIVVHRGGADLVGVGPVQAAEAMAAITRDSARLLGQLAPDVLFLVGDRLDMVPVAMAALPFNLPLAHLHGGELTEGAIDDRIRHALSKLAHWHFVASDGARRRLLAMGEEAWRVHVTGGPGLDTLLAAPQMTRRAFLDEIGFASEPDETPLRLVTVHPETNAPESAAPLKAVLTALALRPLPTLFTAPNSDPGGEAMRRSVLAFVENHGWARFRNTLGSELYPNALRHADVMVGNSSSGIIEAALFGLAVINVGWRQAGRERGSQVHDVPNDAAAVGRALDELGAKPPRGAAVSPYGDGHSAPRIAALLFDLPPRQRLLDKKFVQ